MCIEIEIIFTLWFLTILSFSGIIGVKIALDLSFYYLEKYNWKIFENLLLGHEHTFTGKILQPPDFLASYACGCFLWNSDVIIFSIDVIVI